MRSNAKNLQKVLDTTLHSFMDLCNCDGGSIFTVRKDPNGEIHLVFEAMVTRSLKLFEVPSHLKNVKFKIDSQTMVGRTALNKEFSKTSIEAESTDGSAAIGRALKYQTRNMLSGPLITPRGDLVGVVQLLNKLPYGRAGEILSDLPKKKPDFDARDERLLSIMASQAALAIENSFLLEEQEHLLNGFVDAFVTAVEARDPVTSGHSKRVADFTVALAIAANRAETGDLRDLKFSEDQLREIRFASMLHDLGKISVNEDVLQKEKKLTDAQLEIIRMRLKMLHANVVLQEKISGTNMHEKLSRIKGAWKAITAANEPSVLSMAVSTALQELENFEIQTHEGEVICALTKDEGYRLSVTRGSLTKEERKEIEMHVTNTHEILRRIPWSRGLELVPEIAFKHHEKLDGTGYPSKLIGRQIPIQSQMLTVCDIFDALTATDRPYKPAVPLGKSLDILRAEVREGKLDSTLVELFIEAKIFEVDTTTKRASFAA